MILLLSDDGGIGVDGIHGVDGIGTALNPKPERECASHHRKPHGFGLKDSNHPADPVSHLMCTVCFVA